MGMVTKKVWAKVEEFVKAQCLPATIGLITELEKWFPPQELLNAIVVIYPQNWLAPEAEVTFSRHMAILQAHFGHPKPLGNLSTMIGPLIDPILLD
jgi:hypothetical protein